MPGPVGSYQTALVQIHRIDSADPSNITVANGATTTTTVQNINIYDLKNLKGTAIGASSVAFIIKVQGSVDGTKYVDLHSGNLSTGTSAGKVEDVPLLPYMRVHITNSSGGSLSGTVDVDIIA